MASFDGDAVAQDDGLYVSATVAFVDGTQLEIDGDVPRGDCP